MLEKILTTARHSLIYAIPNFVNKFIGFLLLPLVTTYLTPREFGIWAVFEVTINFLSQILTFGQGPAYIRHYYQMPDEPSRNRLFSSQWFFLFCIVLLVLFSAFIFTPVISQLFNNPEQFHRLMLLATVIVALRLLTSFNLSELRAVQQPTRYASVVILQALILLASTWGMFHFYQLGLYAVFGGHIVASLMGFMVSLGLVYYRFTLRLSWQFVQHTIAYGAPLVFGSIGWLLLNMGDRYVLKYLTNYTQTGLYSFAYKIGQLPFYFVVQPFTVAFLPLAIKWYESEKNTRYFVKVFFYLSLVMVLISLILILWIKEVVQLFTPRQQYWQVYSMVWLITFGYFWAMATQIVNIAFSIRKKTLIAGSLSLGMALLNIGLNFVFIPYFGYTGAAIATVISFMVQFAVAFVITRRLLMVKYELNKFITMLAMWGGLVAVNYLLIQTMGFERHIIRILMVISFPIVLLKLNFFERIELETLHRLGNRVLARFK